MSRIERSLRALILAVFVFGSLGLSAELLLIEHTASTEQWIPFALLMLGLASVALLAVHPGAIQLRTFRIVMLLFIGAGLLGVYYHFAGNVEFALERDPSLTGLALVWKTLGGATPTLAPGAMAQLGLLGLIYAFRHPAAGGGSAPEGGGIE